MPPGEQAEPAAADEYVVRPHDTYWTISQERYGTGAYFKALYEHNRRTYPRADKLRAGDRLIAPEAAELERLYPDLIPRLPAHGRQHAPQPHRAEAPIPSDREYVVHAGDTLFDIARYELGKASRWNEIYELNREAIGENFNRLRPGTRLVLPAERNEILSRQETEAWQR